MVTYEEETLAKLGISLQDLELFVSRSKAGQYLLVAGIALLIYDWFCTAEDEWNYMWKQKPRLRTVKVLFALVSFSSCGGQESPVEITREPRIPPIDLFRHDIDTPN